MNQREIMYQYDLAKRHRFNDELFNRSDDAIVEALKKVILSCERHSMVTIKVQSFEVIDNYDEIMHILWANEDAILNKKKPSTSTTTTTKKSTTSSKKKQENQYDFISLKDSDIRLLKVTYFAELCEVNFGMKSEEIVVYIAIPRIVNKYYFRLNGNYYSAMYQIVDASTYNNSDANSSKKQIVVCKTMFTPINMYRFFGKLNDIDGHSISCTYFMANIFSKTIMIMEYFLAKYGLYDTLNFLRIPELRVVSNYDGLLSKGNDQLYVFPVGSLLCITIPKPLFDQSQIVQSMVYTIYHVTNISTIITSYKDVFSREFWLMSLGSEFSNKDNVDSFKPKGLSILDSLEFSYDILTKEDIRLNDDNKADIYRILRWMVYEYAALRQKDNVDVSTKKVRFASYIAALYAAKLAKGIYRLSDLGTKATMNDIRKALKTAPMFLIKSLSKADLVNYNDCVNDNDAMIALKYTYKGIQGIGDSSNGISEKYRQIHPSHMGRLDIDSSSNSDPGVSGTLAPLNPNYHNNHFTEFEEPCSWESKVGAMIDDYNKMTGRMEMARLINSTRLDPKPVTEIANQEYAKVNPNVLAQQQADQQIQAECASVAKRLIEPAQYAIEGVINGYDILGDGNFFVIYE